MAYARALDPTAVRDMFWSEAWRQKFRRVTDVGGSSGHFLARVLRRYPRLTGVVADLPSVIERAARPAWSPGGQFADLAHR